MNQRPIPNSIARVVAIPPGVRRAIRDGLENALPREDPKNLGGLKGVMGPGCSLTRKYAMLTKYGVQFVNEPVVISNRLTLAKRM